MSVLATTQVPKPTDEQAFERACVVLWRGILKDPNVQKNGRRGQRQDGVDLFGYRDRSPDRLVGIQCKLKGASQILTEREVRQEVGKALTFEPPLVEYLVATTAPDDAVLQRLARELTAEQSRAGRALMIGVWGWDTLQERIAEHPEAARAFDPTFTPFGQKLSEQLAGIVEQQVGAIRQGGDRLAEVKASLERIEVQVTLPAAGADATVGSDPVEAHLDAEIDNIRDVVAKNDPRTALLAFERLLVRVEDRASGRIVFRTKANIGICHFVLGHDGTAASFLAEAYRHAPQEPRAVANMALAMLLRGETRRLREFASIELAKNPGNDHLAALLVQAVKHDDGVGEPLDLVPAEVKASAAVVVARVEFLRVRRREPDWWNAAREARAAFPDEPYARQFAAEAVIDELQRLPALRGDGIVPSDVRSRVEEALVELVERWRTAVDGQGAIRPEHVGLCCNIAGTLLSLGDGAKAADIVRRGRESAPNDAELATRAVLVGLEIGDEEMVESALPALPEGPDADLLRFRICALRGDWNGLVALDGHDVPPSERAMVATAVRLARLRVAASEGLDPDGLRAAIDDAATDARASVLAANTAMHFDHDELAALAHRNAVGALDADPNRAARAMIARLSAVRGDWQTVVATLHGHVDPSRDSEELRLLAAGFVNATPIRQSAPAFFRDLGADVAEQATYLQARGLMNFNRGALPQAETYLRQALAAEPDLRSLLALTATLRRRGRADGVADEIAAFDVASLDGTPVERMGVCHELMEAGRADEAFHLGYRVLKEAPGDPKVAQRYIGLALRDLGDRHIPRSPHVAVDAWIRLESDSGDVFESVIEADATLRGDGDVSPTHPLASAAVGMTVGGSFERPGPLGTITWKVAGLKHKALHALHRVMDTFQTRFPDEQGFFRIQVVDGDVSPLIEGLKRSSEDARVIADLHLAKQLPLACAGARAAGGAIGLAGYLASIGADVATCLGTEPERIQARVMILSAHRPGAVLDAFTAWTAANLDLLDTLKALLGEVIVPQSAVDEIRCLKDPTFTATGGSSIAWRDGGLTRRDFSAEYVEGSNAHIDRLVAELEAKCLLAPVLAPDRPSELATTVTEAFAPDVLDAAHLALSRGAILVSDDLHYRQLAAQAVGTGRSVWLQGALMVARERGLMTPTAYDVASVGLAARRHGHVSFDADMLARFVAADGEGLERLTAASRYIGGATADMSAHVAVVGRMLNALWANRLPELKDMRATGLLIDRLVGRRRAMQAPILAMLWRGSVGELREYIETWATGHMIPRAALLSALNRAGDLPAGK